MSFIPNIKTISGTGQPRLIKKLANANAIYTPALRCVFTDTTVIESDGVTAVDDTGILINQLVSAYVENLDMYSPTYAKITANNSTGTAISLLLDEWSNGTPAITITPPVAVVGSAGNVNVGTHSYKVTYVINGQEVSPSAKSNVVTVSSSAKIVDVTIPVRPSYLFGTTSARKLYRTVAGDTGNWKLVATIANNTATTYADNIADASLGADAPSNSYAGAFLINGWVADLPRTQQNGLREIFTPFQLIHKVFRGRKLNKKYGYEYQAILDYSQFISADTLLLIQKHLSATETDQLILIPRKDYDAFQYNVFIDSPIETNLLGDGLGHKSAVLSFSSNELVVNFPVRNGYGTNYGTDYGTCL